METKNKEVNNEVEEYLVNISEDAEKDLNEIHDFIAKQNPKTAISIINKLKVKIYTLDHFPFRGSYVPELLTMNIKDYRQLTESPWRIIYKVDGIIVNIVSIIDSRRDLDAILKEKFLSPNFWK